MAAEILIGALVASNVISAIAAGRSWRLANSTAQSIKAMRLSAERVDISRKHVRATRDQQFRSINLRLHNLERATPPGLVGRA